MDWNIVATQLETICKSVSWTDDEGVVRKINVLDYVPDDLPNTGMYIGEMDYTPNQSFNSTTGGARKGTDAATITLRLLVARSTDRWAIRKMRVWLAGSGDSSLLQALQATNRQPATYEWSGIKVTAMRGNRLFVVGDAKFYGTEIEIYVTGAA